MQMIIKDFLIKIFGKEESDYLIFKSLLDLFSKGIDDKFSPLFGH